MLRIPSATIAWASSVDVVVPSPTASPVRSAAPRSNLRAEVLFGILQRSNSLAIVTPSLQTIGCPQRLSISTHLDLGPSVTRIGVGDRVGAAQDLLPGVGAEHQSFVRHGMYSSVGRSYAAPQRSADGSQRGVDDDAIAIGAHVEPRGGLPLAADRQADGLVDDPFQEARAEFEARAPVHDDVDCRVVDLQRPAGRRERQCDPRQVLKSDVAESRRAGAARTARLRRCD